MAQLICPRKPPKQWRALSAHSWATLQELDQILLDRELTKQRDYHSLRRVLNSVPRAERGLDWAERVVALYCAKHMRSQRSAALKINIREARLAAGETEALEAFFARLRETIAPFVLTNHGLQLPFANMDQDAIARDLTDLFSVLERLGYMSFINSGTLLGAVREGRFLGHDDDADLAVLIDGADDHEVAKSMQKLCDDLNAEGSLREPAWFHHNGPVLKVLVGSGIEVDLFPLWLRNDKAYIWPHTYGELSKDDIFPLGRQTLCGVAMPAPRDAEKMLELNYGSGWRHPDPDYFFPWNEAKIRFRSVLKVYAKSRKPRSIVKHLLTALERKPK